ncbi:DUF3375 domain-containing protein [Flaviaesturariibacter amylovorans]|uniref:DUF3375 domain-containing protein n=1 Tax=Flaviaesturariibacter amylovorans TaxID=1084520 RepID=A0ABP8H628_9BACT
MNFEKALSLYRNDKTLQLLRAEHFPLLVSFFHLAFKQQDRIAYPQAALNSLLSDFLFALGQQGITDYNKTPLEYLQKWAQLGFLRRYYDLGDDPVYELSPATENALKWLGDLNKQQFVGTHSRLLQFFSLLKQIVNSTAGPYERVQQLLLERKKIDEEIERVRAGNFSTPTDTQIKEDFLLAEETAKRLLSDFRQVEENFRELDIQTRQTIIKSNLNKGALLDAIFEKQDHLWNTDQGKSFRAFWEFLMSESMQQELEHLLDRVNAVPIIQELKKEEIVDRIKANLVEAGDKVNKSNDGLIEQLRKYVEQKNLSESKHILRNIEAIEELLMERKDTFDVQEPLMEIDGTVRPTLFMERPLFTPPIKIAFQQTIVEEGRAESTPNALFEQFYIDMEELRNNVKALLRTHPQVSLSQLLDQCKPTKGVAELLGYIQIATSEAKHYINNEKEEAILVENKEAGTTYEVKTPLIIFNR